MRTCLPLSLTLLGRRKASQDLFNLSAKRTKEDDSEPHFELQLSAVAEVDTKTATAEQEASQFVLSATDAAHSDTYGVASDVRRSKRHEPAATPTPKPEQ